MRFEISYSEYRRKIVRRIHAGTTTAQRELVNLELAAALGCYPGGATEAGPPMTGTSRRPGPESTLDEVREQLIDAAMNLLRTQGVDIGLGHLTLADAIADAGVSRSSAYRSLADSDLTAQAVLHREVLARILGRDTRERNRVLVAHSIADEFERQEASLGSDDLATRTRAVRSLLRAGTATSYDQVAASIERSILTASYGALRSTPATDWRHQQLIEGERLLASLFSEIYSEMSATIGYRLRPGLTLHQFSTAIIATVEGIAMRQGVSDHLDGIERPTGPRGEMEQWTLFGVAFEGIYTMFFEPVGEEPFADLLRY